jgi:hypothetical protein
MRCVCGCGRKNGVQLHHVVYQQELRNIARGFDPDAFVREMHLKALRGDRRNLVPVGPLCHAAHHNRSRPLRLSQMPDSVFEFAVEHLGAGPAYEYLRRRYAGNDARLEALLSAHGEAPRV